VTSIAANSLVIHVSGKAPKEMTFDLTGATIKAGRTATRCVWVTRSPTAS